MPDASFRARRRRARLKARLWAEAQFFLRAVRILGARSLLLAAVALLGALLLRYFGAPAWGSPLSWSEALFTSYTLMLLEYASPLPDHPVGQAVFYVQPLLGVLVIGEGLIELGLTAFRKEANQEVWMQMMARVSRQHVILCGLGTVGFRVLEELARLGEEVFVVERDKDSPFLDRARKLGAHVFIGDARAEDMLRGMNVADARAVIIATNDDLANLEIAMDIRELRADIPVVMRLWDQRLAQKVRGTLGINVSVSTSLLAAPLFASAAMDTSVVGVHRVGEVLLMILEICVEAGSSLDGVTVGTLAELHQLQVAALRRSGAWEPQPSPRVMIQPGDRLHVMVAGDRIRRVHQLNEPIRPPP